jgi:zinc protease
VSFGADSENVGKAALLVLQNLREMQTVPVSEAELLRAKAQLLRQLPMQRASVGAIAGLYLRLSELGLPIDSPDIAARRYLETTAPQIEAAFAAWLRPDDLVEVVKGPPLSP